MRVSGFIPPSAPHSTIISVGLGNSTRNEKSGSYILLVIKPTIEGSNIVTFPSVTFKEVVVLLAATILPNIVTATPTVEGNVITWTEEGWHQVQLQSTYESICNGGRQCTVPNGVYTVINHGTGERFMNIAVPNGVTSDAPVAPVHLTGQLISYAAGDDGDYRSGVSAVGQRFQDNEDGTFDDTLTGLTWLSVRDCIRMFTWWPGIEYANNYAAGNPDCPELTDNSEAGDWRMPNIKELYSLSDYSQQFPAWDPEVPLSGNWIADPFGFFWSSTSFAVLPDTNAIALNSGVAFSGAHGKTSRVYYVWPVRETE